MAGKAIGPDYNKLRVFQRQNIKQSYRLGFSMEFQNEKYLLVAKA